MYIKKYFWCVLFFGVNIHGSALERYQKTFHSGNYRKFWCDFTPEEAKIICSVEVFFELSLEEQQKKTEEKLHKKVDDYQRCLLSYCTRELNASNANMTHRLLTEVVPDRFYEDKRFAYHHLMQVVRSIKQYDNAASLNSIQKVLYKNAKILAKKAQLYKNMNINDGNELIKIVVNELELCCKKSITISVCAYESYLKLFMNYLSYDRVVVEKYWIEAVKKQNELAKYYPFYYLEDIKKLTNESWVEENGNATKKGYVVLNQIQPLATLVANMEIVEEKSDNVKDKNLARALCDVFKPLA
ncbi:MAG TPA: hypothetical protein VEK38_00180 [Candidatus Bathyarchaeia archaeon]|nr:hypothetical protein [Candidatus Bathyarchaeia archaeon]